MQKKCDGIGENMRQINNLNKVHEFCRALNSPLRIKIVKALTERRAMNLNEIAVHLGVTNGAITSHIKILHEAEIISIKNSPGKRGLQKTCSLKETKILLDLKSDFDRENIYEVSLPIGSYSRIKAMPTCGLATKDFLIGEVDSPRYFDDPMRSNASMLWFTQGYVEYRIPNYLKPKQVLKEIQISFEISSEAPGVRDEWPSDIHFYLNDVLLGDWTSPGDYGAQRGRYTPDWWFDYWNQYGLLKLLTINSKGCFIDGLRISDINISQLNIDNKSELVFRFEVPKDAENVGGITLFGKGFGNYNQDIEVRIMYK